MKHSISVIIPAKNEERLIGGLLGSLARQDCASEVEVVLADAFSTDATRKIANSFASSFRSLQIVDGGMPWTGRNLGAQAASGDLFIFLDADLIVPRTDFLSEVDRAFDTRGLAIATVYLRPISERRIDHMLVGGYNVLLTLIQRVRPLGAMCIIATRAAFEQVGGYPEDVVMSEDHDFVLYASRIGRYGILPLRVHMSVRRLDKEGRWGLTRKYMYATCYRVMRGPIREPIFDYEFTYDDVPS